MILIVDDDLSVTTSLSLLLRQSGYRAQALSNPAEALALITSQAFQLVILDMNFSRRTTGEEGLELLQQIKAAQPNLPVILLTAWGSIQLAVAGVRRRERFHHEAVDASATAASRQNRAGLVRRAFLAHTEPDARKA